MATQFRDKANLKILEFTPALASKFKEINEEWIRAMFRLEAKDQKVLDSPEEVIIRPGGHILFIEVVGLGVVGTCALLKTGENEYELTKMGVLESARGSGAGRFLLEATIAKAQAIGAKRLYLLTNKKCASAIHLYETCGFRHDPQIMAEFGGEYARCDVAMLYSPLS